MIKLLYLHASAELFGSDYLLLSLLKSLDRKKFEPLVILPFDGPLCGELRKIDVAYQIYDLPVLRRQYFTSFGIALFLVKSVRCLFFLVRLIYGKRIDLVHTNTAAVWGGGFAAFLTRRPHYWQVMELVERPKLVSWLMRKIVGRFSTKVFCISDAVREFFICVNPIFANKFETLYHGVYLNEYNRERITGAAARAQLGVSERHTVVTFAGRFNAWKGQNVLAGSIPYVLEKTPHHEVHFLFIGSCFPGQEHFDEDLRKQIAKISGSAAAVTVLGFQDNLPEWLAASDIFILPSTSPEPNATVALAAMAMGLPVIGTSIGGTPETIVDGQTGLLIPPNQPVALADAIIKLINDPDGRRSMGERGYERVKQRFSLQSYCTKVIAEYG